jgi:hypothetical protein
MRKKYQNGGFRRAKLTPASDRRTPQKSRPDASYSKTTRYKIKKNFANRQAMVLTRPGFRIGGLHENSARIHTD